jgi:hypothetical protein
MRGPPRIDQRTEKIEDGAPARRGKFLAHRGDVLEGRMKIGCEKKNVAELLERMLQFPGGAARSHPTAERRSALPHFEVMPRLPCFITGTRRTPAPASPGSKR